MANSLACTLWRSLHLLISFLLLDTPPEVIQEISESILNINQNARTRRRRNYLSANICESF